MNFDFTPAYQAKEVIRRISDNPDEAIALGAITADTIYKTHDDTKNQSQPISWREGLHRDNEKK